MWSHDISCNKGPACHMIKAHQVTWPYHKVREPYDSGSRGDMTGAQHVTWQGHKMSHNQGYDMSHDKGFTCSMIASVLNSLSFCWFITRVLIVSIGEVVMAQPRPAIIEDTACSAGPSSISPWFKIVCLVWSYVGIYKQRQICFVKKKTFMFYLSIRIRFYEIEFSWVAHLRFNSFHHVSIGAFTCSRPKILKRFQSRAREPTRWGSAVEFRMDFDHIRVVLSRLHVIGRWQFINPM